MIGNRNAMLLFLAALAVWIVYAVTHASLVFTLAVLMTGIFLGYLLSRVM